jgi:hypothetical protein
MKTKKKERAPSRMTRGVKVGAKGRRHGRKPAERSLVSEAITEKLNILTPL